MKRSLLAVILGLTVLLAACAPPGGGEADEPDSTPSPTPTQAVDDGGPDY